MLSVWWDFQGIVYFEVLPRNQTINLNVYCRQLMKLENDIKEKRPESYSPNLAPSDCHLFRSLQNHLNRKTFDSNEAAKNDLIPFFPFKNETFYESEIMKLTERWQKVIKQNGQYIID